MSRLTIIGATICLLISTVSFADEIYKWVNEKGQVNYGSNPPVGVDAHLVTTIGAPSEDEVKEAKAISDSIGSATTSGKSTSTTPAIDPTETQAKKEACDKAKEAYEKIMGANRVSVKDAQGNYTKADAEQRQAMIDERQEAADKACAP